MLCPLCKSDNPSQARFCLVCGASLAARCSYCQTELPVGSRFCLYCGQPIDARTPDDDARHARMTASAPAPHAEKMRSVTELSGERRLITILFAEVVGSSLSGQPIEAETWQEIINAVFDRIAPAVYRYEGTIARLLGDGLWAFFGAPVAHEDDQVRAVRASLDLLDTARSCAGELLERYAITLAVRVCMHTGSVILGPVGQDLR